MRRFLLTASLLGLIATQASPVQAQAYSTAWLQGASVPIYTIDPTGDDFSDLAPLKAAIGDARVVMLGEQTHGDGATFLMKSRLVRFLHEQLGFNVLVFESGLYDCEQARQQQRPAAACILPVWSESHQMRPLFAYLDANRDTLTLTGMDIQLTDVAYEFIASDLSSYLTTLNINTLKTPQGQVFLQWLLDLSERIPSRPPPNEEAIFFAVLDELQREIAASAAPDAAYWLQVLASTAVYANEMWHFETIPDGYIQRDVQMGRNVLWLAGERYAGEKLIVWTAGYHAVRNLYTARSLRGEPLVYPTHTTAGDIAHSNLGDDLYVINFTSAAGTYFDLGTQRVQPVPPPQPGSFEAQMAGLGYDTAFIDLRGAAEDTDWVGTPHWNYDVIQADWSLLMDGIVFIDPMTPSDPFR
jgi:erythromycin esterase